LNVADALELEVPEASAFLLIGGLTDKCVALMLANITVENVCTFLHVAVKFDMGPLRDACVNYVTL
jgi:hypothetical protein